MDPRHPRPRQLGLSFEKEKPLPLPGAVQRELVGALADLLLSAAREANPLQEETDDEEPEDHA